MCSGSEEGSYLRLIDFCITQLTLEPAQVKEIHQKQVTKVDEMLAELGDLLQVCGFVSGV